MSILNIHQWTAVTHLSAALQIIQRWQNLRQHSQTSHWRSAWRDNRGFILLLRAKDPVFTLSIWRFIITSARKEDLSWFDIPPSLHQIQQRVLKDGMAFVPKMQFKTRSKETYQWNAFRMELQLSVDVAFAMLVFTGVNASLHALVSFPSNF